MPPSTAVGQVSPDGQFRWDGVQWVPIPRGTREPTGWTRPMQLVTAGVLVLEAVYGVVTTAIFVNHDTLRQNLQQNGSQVPQGMSEDQFISAALISVYVVVGLIALVQVVAAVFAYVGWRWAFWLDLCVVGVFALFSLFGLFAIGRSVQATLSAILGLGYIGVFAWMLVGLRYGPWAMKRPGAY